jgi:uncharacterized membrane protein|tara:strand:+ start:6234 stop:6488 length:255 start_codon:yes stop_codon:yes gene_type:complete
MVKKEENFSEVSYMFGIMSIVFAFFTPLVGVIFGIIGIIQSKKQKTPLSEKGKKLSIIGMIISVVLFITLIVITYLKIGINPLV